MIAPTALNIDSTGRAGGQQSGGEMPADSTSMAASCVQSDAGDRQPAERARSLPPPPHRIKAEGGEVKIGGGHRTGTLFFALGLPCPGEDVCAPCGGCFLPREAPIFLASTHPAPLCSHSVPGSSQHWLQKRA